MMQLVERGGRITARAPIDERVLRYAPLLRFARDESYFPIDPSTFVQKSLLRRYGWSEEVRDAVWHPRRSCWVPAPTGLPASADALGGPDLNDACRLIQFEARGTEGGFNRRPCDAHNLWRGRRAGYALEVAQPLSRDLRGVPAAAPWLLYDRYTIETAVGPREVIGYWFCYGLHATAQAHEGDWGHVSLVLSAVGAAPLVRFEGAGAMTFGLDDVESVDGTHAVLYVEPGSHAMFRTATEIGAGDTNDYSVLLRSWRLEPRRVAAMSWSCFDGAWGRVGGGPRTTGPLGPLFRRETAATIARSVAAETRR